MTKEKKLGKTLIILGVLIIAVVGYNLTQETEEEKEKIIDSGERIAFENTENYEFEEINGAILVRNENLNFSFEIPSDWEIETFEEEIEDLERSYYTENPKGITFFSPDYYVPKRGNEKEGCEIGVIVYDYAEDDSENNDLLLLKDDIYRYAVEGEKPRYDHEKLIEIGGYYGVGYLFNMKPKDWQQGQLSTGDALAKIPIGERIFHIATAFSVSDAEKCQEAFYNLLDSISFPEKNEE